MTKELGEVSQGGWYQPVLTPHEVENIQTYGRRVLAHTTLLARYPTLVEDVNRHLEDSGWSLRRESPPGRVPEPEVVTLVLFDGSRGAEPVPSLAAILESLYGPNVPKWVKDLVLTGTPAGKPSAITRGEFGRIPTAMVQAGPPPRRPLLAIPHGRRPVVAILDTRVDPNHPWLGPADAVLGGEGFWVSARHLGWRPGAKGPKARDGQQASGRLAGQLDSHEGHGTFVAGLIRQVAPDAQVLALDLMHDDGTVHADDLLNGVGWLRDEVSSGRHAIDVVCLTLTYQPAVPEDMTFISWLGRILGELGQLGVRVVAAAGNDGTDEPNYPAAFADAGNPPATPLVSVGAYNPNGTTVSYYSNHGSWVTTFAVGTSLVSTFPKVDSGARPELGSPTLSTRTESIDPDDFTGGFARWSGTSFAAAVYAAHLANEAIRVGHPADGAIRVG